MISIIIPIYNEEENIGPLYESLTNTLKSLLIPFEIIFVNDGSSDRSEEFLLKI